MELGNNIRNIRKQRGLRQEQLAEAMGVSVAAVSKWETNQSFPELTVLAELADFFEVSMDTLVGHSLKADRMEEMIAQIETASISVQKGNWGAAKKAAGSAAEKWEKHAFYLRDKIFDKCLYIIYNNYL